MNKDPVVVMREYKQVSLAATASGKFFLIFKLTVRQQSFVGQRIDAFNCWRSADLCGRHLKRPHMTCITCKLRRVVIGELPLSFQISIHQVWATSNRATFRNELFKNALSFAELLS